MIGERAQALDALKQLARDIGLVDDVASRRSDPDRDHQQMRARLKAWRREILLALDILEAPAAPSVGVSPQLEADFQATADHIVSGIETKAESQIAWEICEALKEAASLSPVEPTPLSERHLPPAVVMLVSAASAASGYLERLQPDLAVRLWAGVQAVISTPDKTVEPKPLTGAELLDRFRQVEPAPPTPAPCVWREAVQINHAPFVDTPVKQAKRRAFDDPTIANLDALIGVVIAAEAKPLRDALELIRTMTQGVSPTAAINVAAEVWSICRDALSRRTDR